MVTFEVGSRLGGGGFGEVYLAQLRRGPATQLVALKRIRGDLLAAVEYQLQFEREARICALLDHPHVVKLVAYGTDDVGPYLALEYVNGRPSSALDVEMTRRGQRLPREVVNSICRDAARGLAYAHQLEVGEERGVIHRDLSPDNILVAYEGITKISDFGIARAVGSTRMTTVGGVKGKYGFMSPELMEGGEPSVQTDLFAFAATMYRLFAGEHAFDGKNEAELVYAVLKCRPARLGARCDVPPAIDDWVMQALRKKPSARPDGVLPVLTLLEELCRHRPDEGRGDVRSLMHGLWPQQAGVPLDELARAPTAMKRPPAKVAPAGRRGGPWLVAAAAAVVAVLGLGLWLWPAPADPGRLIPFERPEEPPPEPINLMELSTKEGVERAMTRERVRAQMGPRGPINKIDVRVTSEPPGATVQLEGIKQAERTPMVLKGLRPGESYRVDVTMPGRYAWSETFKADGRTIEARLDPMPAGGR